MTASWRDVLPIHPAAELFPRMSPDELRDLGEDIKKYGLRSPNTLWKEEIDSTPLLLDGRSRLDAIEAAGLEIEVTFFGSKGDPQSHAYVCLRYGAAGALRREVPQVDVQRMLQSDDPYAFVISANIHRRHLTAEQKRELIAKLLKVQPEQSNRHIAESVKASHHTVGAVRAEMESTGQIAQLTETIGKDRKARAKPKRRAVEHFKRDLAAKKAAVPKPPTETIVREAIAPDEQLALLREFAAFVINRARSVSVDPKDHDEWKTLRSRVKQTLGRAP
jgi:hypothetical protein